MTNQYLFFALAGLSVFSALMVLFSKSPVYSALWLIVCFFTVAGHYVMLNAQFLAIVHIIVYAGAIMVLFLFTVMLLNLNKESEPQKPLLLKVAAVCSGGILFLVLVAALSAETILPYSLPPSGSAGLVESVGRKLYTDYLLPFEVSSILFLSAMTGAVILAKKETV